MNNSAYQEPAFPRDHAADGHNGMTLRDYFAGKALNGICASGPAKQFTDSIIAKEAYGIADAMLLARSRQC